MFMRVCRGIITTNRRSGRKGLTNAVRRYVCCVINSHWEKESKENVWGAGPGLRNPSVWNEWQRWGKRHGKLAEK